MNDLVRELQAELDRRESQILELRAECEALRKVIEMLSLSKMPDTQPLTVADCHKHPGANKTRAGGCSKCAQAQYAKKHEERKRRRQILEEQRLERLKANRKPTEIEIPCETCLKPFPNAKEKDRHKTLEHFSKESTIGSSLSPRAMGSV